MVWAVEPKMKSTDESVNRIVCVLEGVGLAELKRRYRIG